MPEPVPPEMTTLQRHAADDGEKGAAFGRDGAELDQLIERQPVALEFADGEGRTVDGDSGGAMTLTRLPSGRRASQIGLDSSTRRPTWLTMR